MPGLPSPFNEPTLRDDLPRYPPLLQLLRVTAATVPGPAGVAQVAGSSVLAPILYVSFTEQLRTDSLLPRDREPCLVADMNGLGLLPGFYLGRLAGSFNSLPVYEVTASGATGSSGLGPTGPQGLAGTAGPAGAVGSTGATGSTGQPGTQGTSGTTGAIGSTGQPGTQGSPGAIGSTGQPGTQGTTGAVGSTGQPGTQGSPGATGSTGPQGPQGPIGSSGSGGSSVGLLLASSLVVTAESTASTSYVDLSTTDEITGGVTLSTATTLLIKYQALTTIASGIMAEGVVNGLLVDGSLVTATEAGFHNGTTTSKVVTTCVYKAPFSAGNHTFKVQHKTLNGSSCTWQHRLLEVCSTPALA